MDQNHNIRLVMDQEFIQIGNFLVSNTVFAAILPAIAALLGTLFGGLITYLTVRASDNRKWQQEKKDRLSLEQREAIGHALEWFDPFRNAITKARLLTGSYLQKQIDKEGILSQWPDLLSHPGLKDPPARLQVWLRPEIYQRALSIVAELNNFVFELYPFPTPHEEWHNRFVQYSDFFDGLDERLRNLEDDLIEEYGRTFE